MRLDTGVISHPSIYTGVGWINNNDVPSFQFQSQILGFDNCCMAIGVFACAGLYLAHGALSLIRGMWRTATMLSGPPPTSPLYLHFNFYQLMPSI